MGWSLLLWRGQVVTLHNLLEHLAANTWVILKVAIISFFKSKLLTLCSGISFIEFRQKCVYNPPTPAYTWYSCPCCPCGNVPFYGDKIKFVFVSALPHLLRFHPLETPVDIHTREWRWAISLHGWLADCEPTTTEQIKKHFTFRGQIKLRTGVIRVFF